MRAIPQADYTRLPGFMDAYKTEFARLNTAQAQDNFGSDLAVLLPILLLLLREGADMRMLLGLVYILL